MRDIIIYNSLHNQKEVFKPIQDGKVSIYICGPTVYSSPHIGNFRPVIVFDVLRRTFIKLGYQVTFVSNFTDVDDKIIKRAKELGISEKELTEQVIKEFQEITKEVGSLPPDITPKPTVYMDQIVKYVDDLVKANKAYLGGDGDVYFRVNSDKDYGELSGNSIEELNAGARIEVNSKKESPLDFALWKKTGDDGIKWPTKWCLGRPGWHTECCVMIDSIFREQNGLIDIHGGGFDLKFPHHENEIAQSIAHNGNKLAHYWMHNGFININNEKMSKSLGNVLLAKDVCAMYGGLAFRLMLLNAHYRAPVSFTEATINEAQTNLNKLSTTYRQIAIKLQLSDIHLDNIPEADISSFMDAMCDDLNTPNALTTMYDELKKANQLLRSNPIELESLSASFSRLSQYFYVLGLSFSYPKLGEEEKALYQRYLQAKANKDFATSDQLRDVLKEKGIL